jgi:hypothetical protein
LEIKKEAVKFSKS